MMRARWLVFGALVVLSGCPCERGFTDTSSPECTTDTDQDGFFSSLCGGDDCDDTDPYVNPGMVDGPWSYNSRFSPELERVRAFRIDAAGDAHWLTQSKPTPSEPAQLLVAHANGLSFGAPKQIAEGEGDFSGHLLTTDEGVHVAFLPSASNSPNKSLYYAAETSDWAHELVADGVTGMTPMVHYQDTVHLAYQRAADGDLYWASRQSDGTWSSTLLLENGRADGLLVASDGRPHVISSGAGACFMHMVLEDDDSWTTTPAMVGTSTCTIYAAAISSIDRIYVLFNSGGERLELAESSGEIWSQPSPDFTSNNVPIDALRQEDVSMVTDSDGAVHIAMAPTEIEATELWYVSNAEGANPSGHWLEELVGFQKTTVISRSSGVPLLAFSRAQHVDQLSQLVLAQRNGGDDIDQNCSGATAE